MRKAVALAPSTDRSEGDAVLTYAHDAAMPANMQSAGIVFAPDGQSAIVRSRDGVLTRIELSTGRVLGVIGEPLRPFGRHFGLFSPDGRYFLLRSDGDEVAIANTHYKRHHSRVRVFALPDYQLVQEYQSGPEQCFDSFAPDPMMFELDGTSVWLACGQHYAPKPDDLLAIKIDVPSMQVRASRRYGDDASSGAVKNLQQGGGAVWAWQFGSGDYRFRIRDLTHDRPVVVLPDIKTPELIGNLTEQTGRAEIDERRVTLTACGDRSGVANPPEAMPNARNSFCRSVSFDTQTGALIGTSDSPDSRFLNTPRASLNAGHGLRIEALWQDDSKTGELIVRDAATGRQRQRIVSVSQRPLRLSPDGQWLVTYAMDRQALRLYRVTP